MANQSFAKHIGSTERGLRKLLDRKLEATGMTFEWWTILVFLSRGCSTKDEICSQLLRGYIVPSVAAGEASILAMQNASLLTIDDSGRLELSIEGLDRFKEISAKVQEAMGRVVSGFEESEMLVVEKVLTTALARVNEILAEA